jgi:hypothetical protein
MTVSDAMIPPDDAVVTTAGVTSHVYDDGEVVGHVLLLDLDGEEFIDAVKVADHLDGVAAVLRSSRGSHHIWCLDVQPFREQALRALSYHAGDDGHVGASWRRGYAVLRVVGKVDADGETYKRRPTVMHVSPSGAEGPHSAAHAAMLRSLIEEQGEEPQGDPSTLDPSHAPQSVVYEGDADDLRLDQYETLTDDAKDALREA